MPGKPINVAIFEPLGNLFGSERSMLDLLGALSPTDVRLLVYCPRKAPWIAELRKLNLPVYDWFRLDLHKKTRSARAMALAKFLTFLVAERVDLIHVNQAGAGPYALFAGRLLDIPVVLHSRWHEDGETIHAWTYNTSALARIVCISRYQKELLETRLAPSTYDLVVVRNPYRRQGLDGAGRDARRPAGTPVFVCPARLHPHKRQDLLVRAAAIYVSSYGPCAIRLLGDEVQGEGYGESLRQLADQLGVSDNIDFAGYSADVSRQLRDSTAMVLPSEIEALGRVVFEAWDAGTVPIAWRQSGGPAETIGESGGGILYADQTPEALAAAMHDAASLSADVRVALV
ncbi:MAG: glycosyltransferase family 4 protein, partial [Alphaproteobacteria bacterium]|nr:glycosyltransferase family 4 protein [Alphaproteobacteria bacterium]